MRVCLNLSFNAIALGAEFFGTLSVPAASKRYGMLGEVLGKMRKRLEGVVRRHD